MITMDQCIDRIEQERNRWGMTIRTLAQRSGISEDALYFVFKHRRNISASELLALSKVLELNFKDFEEVEAGA